METFYGLNIISMIHHLCFEKKNVQWRNTIIFVLKISDSFEIFLMILKYFEFRSLPKFFSLNFFNSRPFFIFWLFSKNFRGEIWLEKIIEKFSSFLISKIYVWEIKKIWMKNFYQKNLSAKPQKNKIRIWT